MLDVLGRPQLELRGRLADQERFGDALRARIERREREREFLSRRRELVKPTHLWRTLYRISARSTECFIVPYTTATHARDGGTDDNHACH
jgi:hypothetical protein